MGNKFYIIFCLGFTFLLKGSRCSFDDSIMLITDSHVKGLYGVSARTNTIYSIPIKKVLNPIAIHYNEINERIYWSDVMLREIRSTSISGHDDIIIRSLDNSSIPDGLAVDPVSKLVFYTDAGNHLIALMGLDGSNHVVIVSQDVDKPRAIVLDHMNGKLYWTDWGYFPKIETANYDGTDRKALVTSSLMWPNALTIDFADQRMYWGDAGTHQIERAKLDGTERKVIFKNANSHFFSMLVYSNKLFYTDWQHRSIKAIPLSGDDFSVNIGNGSFSRLNDISRLKQKPTFPETNACTKNKGGCSHICIPRAKGQHTCLCPTGFILNDDSLCIEVKAQEAGTCKSLVNTNFTEILPKSCLTQASPVGKVCSISCPDGFLYVGYRSEIECLHDGYWSAAVGICVDITHPIIHNCPEEWQLVTARKGAEKCIVSWESIYATDNSGKVPTVYSSMQSDVSLPEGDYIVNIFAIDHIGLFSGCEFTFTVEVHRCGDVPVPERGYIVSGQCPNYYGAKCDIACNTGFQFSSNSGVTTIECKLDKNNETIWTNDTLTCNPITCPQITSPNTEITGCKNPLDFGSVCEQTCSKGFERVYGSNFRICKSDGSWSGDDLKCQEKSVECPKLPHLPEVQVLGCSPPFTVGIVCEQICDSGYRSKYPGTGLRLCKQDGIWSGHDISCVKADEEKTSPHAEDFYNRIGLTNIGILIGGVVLILSLVLMNIGIFVYLRNIGGKIGKSVQRTSTLQNGVSKPDSQPGSQHGVEETYAKEPF